MKRARNKQAKGDRKQDILNCAEELIQESGLESLSIAQVAKKVGLAVGTIYLYFPKKEDIIAHLTIKSREILLQKFIESGDSSSDALKKVRMMLWAYFNFYKEHPFYHQLVSFYETNAGLEEPEELLMASRKITNYVIEVIQSGKAQGSIHPDIDESEFSFLLWASAVGVIQLIDVKSGIIQQQLNKNTDAFFSSYINMIIRSLKK
ncbi:TetR family transcriptional regulator [Algoriphagus aquaeductus]|uniref:TetR family transcriptional regulator n=1 Tax=Algoriphagus aquaeductus TaxID=475299 RepID=A0A326RY07_9BACT|nr:TetR/AcrR family transcriptional regulator [Algoriphagus aquaeductus]PZV87219.1 TetR family transcriptional regulator [Algoriphagus aquaeductus]